MGYLYNLLYVLLLGVIAVGGFAGTWKAMEYLHERYSLGVACLAVGLVLALLIASQIPS